MQRRSRKKPVMHYAGQPARSGEGFILAGILLLGLILRVAYLGEVVAKPDCDAPLSDASYNDYWARGLVRYSTKRTAASRLGAAWRGNSGSGPADLMSIRGSSPSAGDGLNADPPSASIGSS